MNLDFTLFGIIKCLPIGIFCAYFLEIVRHEAAQKMRVWFLGVGLQEQATKHLELLWSKAMVVSVGEKVPSD